MIATLTEKPGTEHTSAGTVVASLEGVSKNYGEIRALRNVNFTVGAGQVVALLGPNGAGKTTAVKLLLGLLQPSSGKARVFGGDPTNPQNRMRAGAMLQVGRVPETLRVREHIDLFSGYYPDPLPLEEVLAAAGLEKLRDRKFGDLSGGQRQRTLFMHVVVLIAHQWRPFHATLDSAVCSIACPVLQPPYDPLQLFHPKSFLCRRNTSLPSLFANLKNPAPGSVSPCP